MRKYSIIVVTLNNASGLIRTLKSIRKLNYSEKEVIVIDGGSDDGSLDVISNNKDIISFSSSEKDSGIYNAMNKGIKYVTGDYVVFMNAGDEFADDGVLSLVSQHNGDIVLGGDIYDGTVRVMKEEMSLYDILSIGIYHQAVYYRREVLQKYHFDESYKIIADLKSVVEPLAKEKISISCISQPLAKCEGGGLSKRHWRDILAERKRMIDEVVAPFYKADYQRFSRINNTILDDFIVLSHFKSIYPIIRFSTKILKFLNKKIKQIPLD